MDLPLSLKYFSRESIFFKVNTWPSAESVNVSFLIMQFNVRTEGEMRSHQGRNSERKTQCNEAHKAKWYLNGKIKKYVTVTIALCDRTQFVF